ncbi:methyltransferase family protein [Aquimarina sp. MAR_2010_214]|uniref:class I SAM-dependent DNA methyltransferase n=1 Tax=Aquimarina sp. MAR_2010_214 TaxID=1250026 RepID=UPI000C6FE693|nr:class I SAM-dependent methyltransferase [Aquimarina sp. MAR_2010_214]PKV51027.1 methyltransferase family protein [Aquimarina sp. MAR_2010_214]
MDKYQETFATWNKIAQIYEDKFMNLDLYNDTYDIFCELISKNNPYILEIGCGPGNITRYLLTKNPNYKIKAIDNSAHMIELARKNNVSAEVLLMDSREIHTISQKFDAIICGFCIPYLSKSDCFKMIADCNKLLNNSGVFYISFVTGNYKDSGYVSGSSGDRMYFYYHDLESIEKELTANSFQRKQLLHKNYPKTDGTEEIHTILIAEKING